MTTILGRVSAGLLLAMVALVVGTIVARFIELVSLRIGDLKVAPTPGRLTMGRPG